MDALWRLPVIAGPVPWIVYAIAAALVLVLLIGPLTPRRLLRMVLGVAIGGLLGLGAFVLAEGSGWLAVAQPRIIAVWAVAVLAAVGLAVVSLWDARVWRKVVAVFAILWFALAGTIGVNAVFGLNPTLGSIFGIVADDPVPLPSPHGSHPARGPLHEWWRPPADMPVKGTQGTQVIPATISGFGARPAGIYLPPAALVADPPALPLVIMMMGFPGNPDPSYIGGVLDDMAAKNNGLAPIVIVADQIGNGDDPACADSTAFGNAETYIKKDVVDWARKNLNVLKDPEHWVIAGYSNGGGCAIKYAAQEPGVFGNIIDVSGEEFPGSEDPASVLAEIYGGDSAAFEAAKPISILQAAPQGAYREVNAVFTAGGADPGYVAVAQKVSDAAKAAGMAVTDYVVPGEGHVGPVLPLGLQKGFEVLYPVLGLSAP
ncbi:alpha/beta hydrolase [Microbacterium sp. CJ88]|uniref:alpha/beta hydrolase n=1 Tax=Microbacterium sp. CJ88 TaxID=3445672 RepID=UPI003F659D1C